MVPVLKCTVIQCYGAATFLGGSGSGSPRSRLKKGGSGSRLRPPKNRLRLQPKSGGSGTLPYFVQLEPVIEAEMVRTQPGVLPLSYTHLLLRGGWLVLVVDGQGVEPLPEEDEILVGQGRDTPHLQLRLLAHQPVYSMNKTKLKSIQKVELFFGTQFIYQPDNITSTWYR